MLASELIAELQNAVAEHGDLRIVVMVDGFYCDHADRVSLEANDPAAVPSSEESVFVIS
jgi:hypothetical protein